MEIVKLLRPVNHEEGVTILMVTHNLDLVRHTDRVVRMAAGRLADSPSAAGDPIVACPACGQMTADSSLRAFA